MPRGNEQTFFHLALQFVSCRAIVGQNGETIHVGMNGVPLFHTWNQLDWHVYLAFGRVHVYLEGSFCFGHFISFGEFAQQVIHKLRMMGVEVPNQSYIYGGDNMSVIHNTH